MGFAPVNIRDLEMDIPPPPPPPPLFPGDTVPPPPPPTLMYAGNEVNTPVTVPKNLAPVDISTIKMDEAHNIPKSFDEVFDSDVPKSFIYRGIPEGVAAATTGGLILNGLRTVSEAGRWGMGKAYKAIEGEELPRYTSNPVPTSHDILQGLSQGILGKDLYEPKTVPGQFANTTAQFGSGGLASGIPLNQSIPSAVVSETAGQLTKDTPYEGPARVLSAALTPLAISGGSRALSALKNRQQPLSSDDIKALSQQAYKQADDAGGVLYPETVNKAIENAKSKVGYQTEIGKQFAGENDVTKALSDLDVLKDKHLSLGAAQEIDENLSERIDSHFDKINGYDKQGVKLLKIQRALRDAYENVSEENVPGGKGGFEAWKQGQQLWSAARHADDVERILAKGETAENPATVYKNGFGALAKTEMRGFTDAEKEAIRHAGKTGLITGALKYAGSRIGNMIAGATGGAAGAAFGGPLGAMAGAAVGGGVGYPFRTAANALQRSKGSAVLGEITNRPYVKEALGGGQPQPPISQLQYQSGASLPTLLEQYIAPQNRSKSPEPNLGPRYAPYLRGY